MPPHQRRPVASDVVGSSSSHEWLIALTGGLAGGSDHISNSCPGHPSVPSTSDGIKDVSLAQAVLQRRSGNDRIVHRSKVTCDVLCGRGVCSRGSAGGCRRFDRPVSVRMPQMYWLTSASSGALMRARLVDSEKSSIVTLSAVCGAGWADRERTFATRTAFSHRTRGWDLSHLQEIAVLAGYRSSRCAAGGCAALA